MRPEGALCALLVAGALFGCTRGPAPSDAIASVSASPSTPPLVPSAEAPAKLFAVHETARAGDYALKIVKVEECKVARYFRPPPGKTRLGVEMQLEATGDKQIPVNGFYAALQDSEGNTYSPTLGGCEPALPTKKIQRPESVSGWVSFEVPEAAHGLELAYNPFIVGSMKQELRFRLPR